MSAIPKKDDIKTVKIYMERLAKCIEVEGVTMNIYRNKSPFKQIATHIYLLITLLMYHPKYI